MGHQFFRSTNDVAMTREEYLALAEGRTRSPADPWPFMRNGEATRIRAEQVAVTDPFEHLYSVEGDDRETRRARLRALLAERGCDMGEAS